MSRPPGVGLLAALGLAVMLSACVSNSPLSKPQRSEISAETLSNTTLSAIAAPPDRQWPDPLADETNQRTRGFGLVHAPELDRYLNRLYEQVKATAGTPGWPGRVHLLANASLDAYATAAGNVYVSLTWLRSVENEDELVALLAHEFGHIHLHYHQLEGALAKADSATGALAVGMLLARKGLQASGWSQLDSLLFAYTASRQLGTGFYSRSQEMAADRFALAVVVRMNRPVESSLKSLLERLQTWEEKNEARLKMQEKAIRDSMAHNAAVKAEREAAALRSETAKSMMRFSGALDNAGQQLSRSLNQGVPSLFAELVQSHPSTAERLDVLVRLAEAHSHELPNGEARTAPLKAVLNQPQVRTLLDNYQLAFDVMSNPAASHSVDAAKRISTGPTKTHALPIYAAYVSRQATGVPDADNILLANFASTKDRAWFLYQERAHRLVLQGHHKQAGAVINQGLKDFNGALAPELYAVRFLGEFMGWDVAKDRARHCAGRHPSAANQCQEAAMSPQERAQQNALNKQKAEALTKKLFKKKN